MTPPMFPAVGADGKIQEAHLPERLQEATLLADIRREAAAAGVASPGLDLLAFKLAFGGSGNHTVAVVADSTMNDSNDSIRIFDRKYSEQLADSVRHVYHNWNTSDDGWRHTVNQEGTIIPAHDGLIVEDSFNRVTADLVGSTPDTGAPWEGTAGRWSSDGAVARASGQGVLSAYVGNRNMKLSATMTLRTDRLNQQIRLFCAGTSINSQNGIMVSVAINSIGLVLVSPYVVGGGESVRIGDQLDAGQIGMLVNSPEPRSLIVEAEVDIQNVKFRIIGPTGQVAETSAVITEEQYGRLGLWASMGAFTQNTDGFALDSVRITTDPSPEQGDTLDVWNGAIAGAGFPTFTAGKLEQMFGDVDVDILVFSMGHNNGSQPGSEFVAQAVAWLDLWMAHHPETQGIVWVSQNPQFSPASNVSFHRDRQMAMRFAAKQYGWEYVSGFEAFSTRPDGGKSLVGADGIHPTTPPTGVLTGDYGAVLVADTILGAVHARI